ncbi:Myc-type, basic helix-loop-helix (bHLH) domain-containing protein [Cynara cardunculus var. scolymus]|uniref:Myc-type, basic helix-loop-helix (BHLH) domain-containing protein n=1 Tax=Cynara cardunculus var. scolymus TaxID=59895 RepID=A0A124SFS7_CYNCS|nr:Myc-type, basic helix-loop-helix (bHLH) domain-containing protein [Cynara cardunculus var. scolymus]
MEIDENPNWLFDYGLMEDISAAHFTVPPPPLPPPIVFDWPSPASLPAVSIEIESSFIDFESPKEAGPRKRLKSEPNNVFGSKAGREKLRRDRMNERHPGRAPKTDKTAILSDAIRMITQLRSESERLNESNAEKNELRDEKQRLKVEKEKLEQQVKSMNGQPSYLAHATAMRAAFAAQEQAAGNKLMPFVGYPSVAMWQFMPSSVVDTSQDHVLRPPVA